MSVKDTLRAFLLKRNRCKEPTGIVPLGKVHKVVTIMNVDDPQYDVCRDTIQAWYRKNNIRGEVFFIDFRKLIEKERLTTSITNTILRKDLDIFGRPKADKMRVLENLKADMVIVLPTFEDSYPLDYLVACCHAGCRVGRTGRGGGIYDIELTPDKEMTQLEFFHAIIVWLEKIQ